MMHFDLNLCSVLVLVFGVKKVTRAPCLLSGDQNDDCVRRRGMNAVRFPRIPSVCVSSGLLLAATVAVLPALHGSALLADQRGLPGPGRSGCWGERTGLSEDFTQHPL